MHRLLILLTLVSLLLVSCAPAVTTMRDPQTGYHIVCEEHSVLDRANLRWYEIIFTVLLGFAPASGGYTSDYNKCITDAEHRGYERISAQEERD